MKKMSILFALIAAAFLMTGAYQVAKADTPVVTECRENLNFTTFVEAVTKDGFTVRPLTDAEKDYLFKTKGKPPVEGDFDQVLVTGNDNSLLIVHQNDCIVAKIGPLPSFIMDTVLGTTKAEQHGT